MTETHARVLVIRHGDVLEAWGRLGAKEDPHRLGADEGIARHGRPRALMQLVADRVLAWNAHAPDPDQPLLLDTPAERAARNAGANDGGAKWWVYATVIGAIAAGALVVYFHDESQDTQRVEVHFP